MKRDEQPQEGVDRWSQLAQELLGEEATAAKPTDDSPEVPGIGAGLGEQGAREERTLDEAPQHALEVAAEQGAASDVQGSEPDVEPASTEQAGGPDDQAEPPTNALDEPLKNDDELIEYPQSNGEDAEAADQGSDKGRPRRSRRGRRRRRSSRSADAADGAEDLPQPVEESPDSSDDRIHDLDLDMEEVAVPRDDSEEDSAKSKAIPTWAEAISYLSPGPEESPPNKDGGARPRRRRRRSKS